MKLAGSHPLPHPPAAVWEALMDPEVLSRTLPGCERLERVEPAAGIVAGDGDLAFRGAMTVQVGPVRGAFQGGLALSDLRPPESYRMKLQGQGPSGFLTGEGEVRLEETPDGGTLLHYDLDAQVGGRVAGVGQRLLESSAKVIAKQGLERLERQLAARHPLGSDAAPAASDQAPPEPSSPTSTDSAAAPLPLHGAREEPGPVAAAPPASVTPPVPVTSPSQSPATAQEAARSVSTGEEQPATLVAQAPSSTAPHLPQAPPAPSQAQFAGRFMKGLWEELVPEKKRGWVLAAAAFIAVLLVLLALRACAG